MCLSGIPASYALTRCRCTVAGSEIKSLTPSVRWARPWSSLSGLNAVVAGVGWGPGSEYEFREQSVCKTPKFCLRQGLGGIAQVGLGLSAWLAVRETLAPLGAACVGCNCTPTVLSWRWLTGRGSH